MWHARQVELREEIFAADQSRKARNTRKIERRKLNAVAVQFG